MTPLRFEPLDQPHLFQLTKTWTLCAILLVFASLYGFSFERGSLNSLAGVDSQALTAGGTGTDIVVKAQADIIYLLSIACVFPLIRPVWRQIKAHPLIFSVLGWAMVSVLWSAIPSTTVINALRMGLNLVLVIYLFEQFSGNDIQRLVLLVGLVAAVGSFFLAIAMPQYGIQTRGLQGFGAWQGIFGQKNLCGLEMLILLLPAFFVQLHGAGGRLLRVGYVFVLLFIIAMTRSAGAWVVTLLCLLFVGLLKLTTRMPRKDAAAIVLPLLGAALLLGIVVLSNFQTLMYALGKDPTMTGRTVLWAGLLHIGMQHPLGGFGYMAFWQGITDGPTRGLALQMGWLGLAGAENGVLELWLELGLVGVLLYAAIFARAVRDALYCIGRGASPSALWYTSILFYVVATNIEGGLLLAPSDLACILPFVAFVGLRREAQLLQARSLA